MSRYLRLCIFGVGLGALFGAWPAAHLQADPPIWETNFGMALGLSDDATQETMFNNLNNFTFPFAGAEFSGSDVLAISSNGFMSIGGNNGDGCFLGDPSQLLNDPIGRITPFWTNLNPSFSGDVFLNTEESDRVVAT